MGEEEGERRSMAKLCSSEDCHGERGSDLCVVVVEREIEEERDGVGVADLAGGLEEGNPGRIGLERVDSGVGKEGGKNKSVQIPARQKDRLVVFDARIDPRIGKERGGEGGEPMFSSKRKWGREKGGEKMGGRGREGEESSTFPPVRDAKNESGFGAEFGHVERVFVSKGPEECRVEGMGGEDKGQDGGGGQDGECECDVVEQLCGQGLQMAIHFPTHHNNKTINAS